MDQFGRNLILERIRFHAEDTDFLYKVKLAKYVIVLLQVLIVSFLCKSQSHKATLFRLYASFLPSKDLHIIEDKTLKLTDWHINNEGKVKLAPLSNNVVCG